MRHEHIMALCKKKMRLHEKKKWPKIPLWGRSWSRNFHKNTYYPFALWAALGGSAPRQKKSYIFTILATLANKVRDALLLGFFFSWIIWRIVMVGTSLQRHVASILREFTAPIIIIRYCKDLLRNGQNTFPNLIFWNYN